MMRPGRPNKDCPDCGMTMGFSSEDFLYYCLDNECGYTEVDEDGDAPKEVEERDTDYVCPHCGQIIEEEDLP